MSEKILVTYATRCGSTAGVAQAIAKTLAEHGALVEVLPVEEASDLSPYQAVIIGSAIQSGAWLPEAVQFVRDHQFELKNKRCSVFLVCMTLSMKNGHQHQSHVSTWLEPIKALVRPVSEGMFSGALEIGKITPFSDRLKFRLSVLLGVWKEGDHRDWKAIRDWSESQVPLLLS